MQQLRNARRIASLVLVWFALFLGSAVASAFVQPDGLQLVCTGSGGMKLVPAAGDGEGLPASAAGMDCPLCAGVAAPPAASAASFERPAEPAPAPRPEAAACFCTATAPPLPSRGPPSITR